MNCEDFNNHINELADYKPLAVSTRDASVSHVALCADCAAKLANARTVSATLLLAAGAESEAAPARIKVDLLTAFAAQQQSSSTSDRVVPIASRRKLGWWAAAAVAAAAVVVFAVVLPIWQGAPSPGPESRVAVKAPPPETPTATPTTTPTATPAVPPRIGEAAPKPSKAAEKRPVLRQRSPRVITGSENETVAGNTVNEFVPLTYLATATAIDTGTIVRVQLSRSALVRLGLPINIESSNETVRAEVVMGDDGVARAIRLIE
ncbi:MAG TPA: hypothetical protein VGO68_03805 [Pyrinomonadaceae bacterium]|jgi:hypothetical protein|nr:hypothetical protein [Pyrinomonadaceae bacterium]